LNDKNNTVSFFDILITLAKHKSFILKTVFSISILALVISLIWPKTYSSSAEVIQTRENIGSLGGMLQNFGSIASGQTKVGGETILVILNSENLKDKLIEEFDLKEVYGTSIKEALYEQLKGVISIEEVREGGFGFNPIVSIKIEVEDQKPERAQAMNQIILRELEQRMQELNIEAVSSNLEIMEVRFQENQAQIEEAEIKLNEFQNNYGILEVSNQVQALIENLAELKTNIVQQEIELTVMTQRLDENSSQVLQKRQELEALKQTYDALIKKSESIDTQESVFYSLYDMPDLILRYMRLMREVEVQNKIYELLLPQIEQQKLYLANKGSGLRIIDEPDLPTYKSSPKRAFIVLGGFFFSTFLSLFIVFIRELREDENSEYAKKIDRLKEELKFKSRSDK
jgi:uncharacterized protein involved in exopolysaccharide biosynthesis